MSAPSPEFPLFFAKRSAGVSLATVLPRVDKLKAIEHPVSRQHTSALIHSHAMRKRWHQLASAIKERAQKVSATAHPLMAMGLLLAICALLIIVFVPSYEAKHVADIKRFELENEARKTWSQIALSVFGLFALYFTWRRVVAGDKTVRITEQGHITDRYTKAIEQLGKLDGDKPNIEVRLGGIYALERIARDSPRDHWTIMEVLTAYVRQNARVNTSASQPELDFITDRSQLIQPRTDIQAILTVLGRRERGEDREKGRFLDLRHTNLKGADLRRAHLERAKLQQAHLEGADLYQAHLDSAYFFEAHLEGARLSQAHMEGARLSNAHLEGADLFEAHLEGARLSQAHLQGAMLVAAYLESAYLTEAHLENAYLSAANLKDADLQQAHLEGANLFGANLAGVRLAGAHLERALDLSADQIKAAVAWELAYFDPEFKAALFQSSPESTGETDSTSSVAEDHPTAP